MQESNKHVFFQNVKSDKSVGNVEKHTEGVGSKLLTWMGYDRTYMGRRINEQSKHDS
jgi:hypothetical protein